MKVNIVYDKRAKVQISTRLETVAQRFLPMVLVLAETDPCELQRCCLRNEHIIIKTGIYCK